MFSKKDESRVAEYRQEKPVDPGPQAKASNPRPASNSASASVSTKSSLIDEGFEFIGDMKSGGSLTVDGTIRGNLVVQSLLIGVTGLVDGSVMAESISVEGCLTGAAECKDLVIGGRAVADGKLSYSTISIQRGGTIKGNLHRG